jgi:hypothetical protein
LHADDRSHERRLTRPARAEQSGDGADRYRDGDAVEDEAVASDDVEVFDPNRIHGDHSTGTVSECQMAVDV